MTKKNGGPPREVRTPETEDAALQSFDGDDRRSIYGQLTSFFIFVLSCHQ
jgi:hypothetical protein